MERFLPKIHEALYNFRFMGKPYRKMHIFKKFLEKLLTIPRKYVIIIKLIYFSLYCGVAKR